MPKSSMARRAPSSLSSPQDGQDVLAVVHQDALGHLQDQRRRGQAALLQGPGHVVDHLGGLELAAGQVDVEGQRPLPRRAAALPLGGLPAGLAQHPGAQRPDQPAGLGQGDELGRRDQPPDRVVPAGQGLGPDDLARAEVEGRLVVEEQLPRLQGPPQVALELHPLDQLGVHLGVVALVAALAGRLGPVHGQVGVAQQLVGAVDVAVHPGDAHAAPDVQLAPVDLERLAQPFQHPVGHLDDVDVVAGVLDQHGELVAAEPGHGVAGPHAGVQALGHLDEQPVPGGVAEAVVDLLEAVQVEEQHRHRGRLALGPLEGVVDPVLEQGPVGQRGQRVVEGLVDELVLELAALGDVAGVEDQAADAGVVEQVGDGELDGAPVAVAVAQRQLQLEHAVGPLGHLGQALAQAEPVRRSRGSG